MQADDCPGNLLCAPKKKIVRKIINEALKTTVLTPKGIMKKAFYMGAGKIQHTY